MTSGIPHTADARPDTGLYNGKLGVWLFIASEAMLFGGLFSAYAFLRNGDPNWPVGGDRLHVTLGAAATFVLIASSLSAAAGWSAAKAGRLPAFRTAFLSTAVLGAAFVAVKAYEYWGHIGEGNVPSTSNFYGIYYVLTGVHLLHLAGGLLIVLYHAGPGATLWESEPARFVNRAEVTALYWHFAVLIWLIMFPALYLV